MKHYLVSNLKLNRIFKLINSKKNKRKFNNKSQDFLFPENQRVFQKMNKIYRIHHKPIV
jgi:hypothetical protein